MAKPKRGLIFFTCFSSGLAAALTLLSIGTEQWIVSDVLWFNPEHSSYINKVHYGLFSGILEYNIGMTITKYEITTTCDIGENSCAMLCGATEEIRKKQLKSLIKHEEVGFDFNCPSVLRSIRVRPFKSNVQRKLVQRSPIFINAGVYICTVLFLAISAVLGLLSAFLAVWNTGGNPIYTALSIYGMQYYNLIAAGLVALVVIMWFSFFATTLSTNIALYHTIVGEMTSHGRADAGYSFWINVGSLLLYLISAGVLYLRQFLINREPEVKVDIEDVNNDIILF